MMSISARRALTEARIVLAEQRIERLTEELTDLADEEPTMGEQEQFALVTARLRSWNERLATLQAIHADLAGGW